MSSWKSLTFPILVICGFSASLWTAAADDSKGKAGEPKASKTAEKPAEKPAEKADAKTPEKAKGRLPSGYGKLDLGDDQKERIYAIQTKYESRIDELEAKLAALKQERDTEIEGVLTADQKKKLAAAEDEKKQKSAAKKKLKADKE